MSNDIAFTCSVGQLFLSVRIRTFATVWLQMLDNLRLLSSCSWLELETIMSKDPHFPVSVRSEIRIPWIDLENVTDIWCLKILWLESCKFACFCRWPDGFTPWALEMPATVCYTGYFHPICCFRPVQTTSYCTSGKMMSVGHFYFDGETYWHSVENICLELWSQNPTFCSRSMAAPFFIFSRTPSSKSQELLSF